MNDLMKPTIVGALIVAVGVFLAAERVGYLLSFEGRWESCVRTFKRNVPASSSVDRGAESACLSIMMRANN